MKKVIFKECIFNVDYEATIEHYRKIKSGHAEECGCGDCIRFATNRNKFYSLELIQLFNEMGVDYSKDQHLWFCGDSESGGLDYQCDFEFYGQVESIKCLTPSLPKFGGFEFTPISKNIGIRFYPNRDNDFVQVELYFQNICL